MMQYPIQWQEPFQDFKFLPANFIMGGAWREGCRWAWCSRDKLSLLGKWLIMEACSGPIADERSSRKQPTIPAKKNRCLLVYTLSCRYDRRAMPSDWCGSTGSAERLRILILRRCRFWSWNLIKVADLRVGCAIYAIPRKLNTFTIQMGT